MFLFLQYVLCSTKKHGTCFFVHSPYIDAFGSGVIITASHNTYRGEATHKHNTNNQVIGVMGADFPLSYFHK